LDTEPLYFKFWFRYDDTYVSVLSLFTIVQFPNEPCQTSDGVNGTCYHHLQCRSLGGISSGSCAQGYGICCYCKYGICLNIKSLKEASNLPNRNILWSFIVKWRENCQCACHKVILNQTIGVSSCGMLIPTYHILLSVLMQYTTIQDPLYFLYVAQNKIL
jgi:hypothetical protein